MASDTLRFARLFLPRWWGLVSAAVVVASVGALSLGQRGAGPLPLGTVFGTASVALLAMVWTGFALGHHLGEELVRPGRTLIPGLCESRVRGALFLGLVSIGLVVTSLALMGGPWWTVTVLAVPGLAAGLFLGFAFGGHTKASLLSFLLGVGLYVNLASELAPGAGDSAWSSWGGVDLQWWKLLLLGIGLLKLVAFARWVTHLRESALPFLMRRAQASAECAEAEGGFPEPMLLLLPRFARRGVSPAQPGRSDFVGGWRSGTMPITALGYALVLLPFVVMLAIFGRGEPRAELTNNSVLFQANGLIALLAAHGRARFRRELLRPAPRERILTGLARSMGTELLEFWLWMSLVHVAVHALLDPSKLALLGYWGPHLLAPGLLAFGAGIGMTLGRWTRWSGLITFALLWPAALIASAELGDANAPAAVWLGTGAVAALQLVWLLPLARRLWSRLEPARI